VAKALGYTNPAKALADHCKGVTKRYTPTSSVAQMMSYIMEPDIYRLIFGSKLPSAERFQAA
jgi:prophage antirepressor-like protein